MMQYSVTLRLIILEVTMRIKIIVFMLRVVSCLFLLSCGLVLEKSGNTGTGNYAELVINNQTSVVIKDIKYCDKQIKYNDEEKTL